MDIQVKYIRNEEGKFVCPYCSAIKSKQNTMLYHIQSKHTKTFAYTCTRCESAPQFLQKCGYLHHLATVHADNPHINEEEKNPYAEKRFICVYTECNHSTHTRGNLDIHFVRNHLKEFIPSFKINEPCTQCNKIFSSSGAYFYHAKDCFKNLIPPDYINMISRIK
jgi:hypothetical protein